ncbi:MAG: GNAT family N-acetyltransferase [Clostridiales bacterium]|nr:GNAT family N-acetyltransferase [Clostridiales bacterium]
MYEQAMSEEWSREFCETFESAEDYLSKGFGYGITYKGKLVAATSTMIVYDGAIEIQVATREDFRKKV